MKTLKIIITNGFFPYALVLIWNMVLISQLPPAYGMKAFNAGIPAFILICENVFRYISMSIPIFVKMNIHTAKGKIGWKILLFGMVLYLTSWLMQIFAPGSTWSQSVWGFAAPAYTVLIWTIGLGLMLDSYYFKLPYKKWHYLAPSLVFLFFHIYHAVYVFNRL